MWVHCENHWQSSHNVYTSLPIDCLSDNNLYALWSQGNYNPVATSQVCPNLVTNLKFLYGFLLGGSAENFEFNSLVLAILFRYYFACCAIAGRITSPSTLGMVVFILLYTVCSSEFQDFDKNMLEFQSFLLCHSVHRNYLHKVDMHNICLQV